MPATDEQPDNELDEFDKAGHVNFRDYPSSGLVVIAALSSGLGWMLYKWLGKKRRAQNAAPTARTETRSSTPQADPSTSTGNETP